ncbi:nucleoside deaminase [Sulfurihydrogenibium azorense]|jgi:tRNA(adenine34) deaminase|uniref:tRNA-specific adenosine deaminase n=1 Tax=Sulfurihydrogenibium azorense (strain DSM 15241 / OCM 825 / Az-Fu1) TaxID=204536 RepID=C1DXN9_SULAA|nr:nucleoside deaminase [Sulfurihydrogenibium azorense]ACN98850.1 tRNA-specific adenosine deaminase [Sulfurihydrogenibium azorense Az-Fu1]
MKEINTKFIELAIKEAEKALKKGEVPVGAVLVKDDKVVSKGYNLRISKKNALYHAEIVAIERACKKLKSWRLDDTVLYTTLEPCLMCAGAIMQARIKKVVFLAKDEKGGAVLSNYTVFDDKKLPFKVEYSYIPDERAEKLLKDFFKILREAKHHDKV